MGACHLLLLPLQILSLPLPLPLPLLRPCPCARPCYWAYLSYLYFSPPTPPQGPRVR